MNDDDLNAQEEYEDLYYNLDSDGEEFFDCNSPSDAEENASEGDNDVESSRSYLSKGFKPR